MIISYMPVKAVYRDILVLLTAFGCAQVGRCHCATVLTTPTRKYLDSGAGAGAQPARGLECAASLTALEHH